MTVQERGIIFDVDGTLLDSMPLWEHAGERYLQQLGIAAEPHLGKKLFAMTMQEGAQYLQQQYGLSASLQQIIDGIHAIICDGYWHTIPAKPGAVQFCRRLFARGLCMTVATSNDRAPVEAALQRLGLLSCISRIFTCSEVGLGKSHPYIYLQAAHFMQLRPEQIWVFEDALHALRTAKAAGFVTVGIYDETSKEDAAEIKQIADYYMEGFPSSIEDMF